MWLIRTVWLTKPEFSVRLSKSFLVVVPFLVEIQSPVFASHKHLEVHEHSTTDCCLIIKHKLASKFKNSNALVRRLTLNLSTNILSLGRRYMANAYEVDRQVRCNLEVTCVIRTWPPWVWGTAIKTLYDSTSSYFTCKQCQRQIQTFRLVDVLIIPLPSFSPYCPAPTLPGVDNARSPLMHDHG